MKTLLLLSSALLLSACASSPPPPAPAPIPTFHIYGTPPPPATAKPVSPTELKPLQKKKMEERQASIQLYLSEWEQHYIDVINNELATAPACSSYTFTVYQRYNDQHFYMPEYRQALAGALTRDYLQAGWSFVQIDVPNTVMQIQLKSEEGQ